MDQENNVPENNLPENNLPQNNFSPGGGFSQNSILKNNRTILFLAGFFVFIIILIGGLGYWQYDKISKTITKAESLEGASDFAGAIAELENLQGNWMVENFSVKKEEINTKVEDASKKLLDMQNYQEGIEKIEQADWNNAQELLSKVSKESGFYQEVKSKSDILAEIIDCQYRKGQYEMKVTDSKGRVTGLVDGTIKEEIPMSFYNKDTGTVNILFQNDNYVYDMYAVKGGNYHFELDSIQGGESVQNYLENIPIPVSGHHRITIDKNATSNEAGLLLVDDNADGVFEKEIRFGANLTCQEYIARTKMPDITVNFNYIQEFCDKAGEHKDECYYNFAFERKDINLCDEAGLKKIDCYDEFIKKYTSEALCSGIDYDYKYKCYHELAFQEKDLNFCAKIPGQRKVCYEDIIRKYPSENLCEKISDESYKQDCYAFYPSIKFITPNTGESLMKGLSSYISLKFSPSLPSNGFAVDLVGSNSDEVVAHLKYCGLDNFVSANSTWKWKIGYDAKDQEITNGSYNFLVYDCRNEDDSAWFGNTVTAKSKIFNIISVAPAIKVLSPNGGEQWETGGVYQIKWQSSGLDKVGIALLSSYDGNSYRTLTLATSVDAVVGVYDWTIPWGGVKTPNGLDSPYLNGYPYHKIVITDSSYGYQNASSKVYSDESNDHFSIGPLPTISDYPDLELTQKSILPASPIVGQEVVVEVTVTNIGKVTARVTSGGMGIQESGGVFTETMNSDCTFLKPGDTCTNTSKIKFSTPGIKHITADAGTNLAESNAENNSLTISIIVRE